MSRYEQSVTASHSYSRLVVLVVSSWSQELRASIFATA